MAKLSECSHFTNGWLCDVSRVCGRVQPPDRLHARPPPPSSLTRKRKSQHCSRALPARLSHPEVLKRQALVRPLRGRAGSSAPSALGAAKGTDPPTVSGAGSRILWEPTSVGWTLLGREDSDITEPISCQAHVQPALTHLSKPVVSSLLLGWGWEVTYALRIS